MDSDFRVDPATRGDSSKYVVSFNSDTSDSEDERSTDAKPTNLFTVGRGLINGHVHNNVDCNIKIESENEGSGVRSGNSVMANASLDTSLESQADVSDLGIRRSFTKGYIGGDSPLNDSRQIGYNTDMYKTDTNKPDGAFMNSRKRNNMDVLNGETGNKFHADLLVDISGPPPLTSIQRHPEITSSMEIISELEGLSFSPGNKPVSPRLKVNMGDHTEKNENLSRTRRSDQDSVEGRAHIGSGSVCGEGMNSLDDLPILKDADILTVTKGDKSYAVDADLLIFTASGSTERGQKISNSFESECKMTENTTYPRESLQKAMSMETEKYEYDNLDEKFSAICSKYGKDPPSKREHLRFPHTPPGESRCGNMAAVGSTIHSTRGGSAAQSLNTDGDKETTSRIRRNKVNFDDMVNWDKSSMDDLIKQILEDARSESNGSFRYVTNSNATKNAVGSYEGCEHRHKIPEPHVSNLDVDDSCRPQSENHDLPSLLERRLASMDECCKNAEMKNDDTHGKLYKRKSRSSPFNYMNDDSITTDDAQWKQSQKGVYGYNEHDSSYMSAGSYAGSCALVIPPRFDDSDSDNDSYVSRSIAPVLPEEAFIPQRSEETHTLIQERTSEIRNMVENQTEVLGRLKKASDSFDELDLEIRQLKQQVIENQATRQAIMENIIADIKEGSVLVAGEFHGSSPYTPRYNTSSVADNAGNSSSPGTSYMSRFGRTRDVESYSRLDNDLQSERLGGYALGVVAKSKWGEPGGSRAFRSASVCRFDNVEEERYGRRSLNYSKNVTASEEDCDVKSDYGIEVGDDAETASMRSYKSEKSSEDSGLKIGSIHRSRYAATNYTSSGYGGSNCSEGSSLYTRSRAACTSLQHSMCTDYSFDQPRRRAVSVPPLDSKPFSSRFLSKVREKKETGDYSCPKRDKPFRSRFLSRSFDSDYYSGSSSRGSLDSTPDKNSMSPRSCDEVLA